MSPLTQANPPHFQQVAAALRQRIVAGHWAPGSQLPTWDRIAKEFAVTRPTLMRAMDRLRRDGFVYSKSTRGTFVTEHPPHLTRFGLVFTSHPGEAAPRYWNRFWDTLASQAPLIEREDMVQLPVFLDVADENSRGYLSLIDQICSDRLGGLILVGTEKLLNMSLIQQLKLPQVAIFGTQTPTPMPRVYIDHASFIERSLERLIERGRRRIAILSNQEDKFEGYREAFARHGVQSKPFWRLAAAPNAAANVVRLLFDSDNAQVPDGLILTDDNIVESAISGLLQSNVRVPEQLEIVAHCNWPAPVPSSLPVMRLGYDVHDLLKTCVELLRRDLPGGSTSTTLIPARWEQRDRPT